MHDDPKITLVLGAGGARGVAHAGVLRRLRDEGIAPKSILGCSVGAIVAALHAGIGMPPEEMIERASHLDAGSLFAFGLSRWRLPWLPASIARKARPLVDGLEELERASFSRLHHGVRTLGIVTYDLRSRAEVLIHGGPGQDALLPLPAAVKASAAIPGLFPPLRTGGPGGRLLLVDAGWHTAVPIERAFAPPISARHVLAVDLGLRTCLRQASRAYWESLREACGDRLLVLRPAAGGIGTMVPRPGDAARLASAGEESISSEALRVLRRWSGASSVRPPGAPIP